MLGLQLTCERWERGCILDVTPRLAANHDGVASAQFCDWPVNTFITLPSNSSSFSSIVYKYRPGFGSYHGHKPAFFAFLLVQLAKTCLAGISEGAEESADAISTPATTHHTTGRTPREFDDWEGEGNVVELPRRKELWFYATESYPIVPTKRRVHFQSIRHFVLLPELRRDLVNKGSILLSNPQATPEEDPSHCTWQCGSGQAREEEDKNSKSATLARGAPIRGGRFSSCFVENCRKGSSSWKLDKKLTTRPVHYQRAVPSSVWFSPAALLPAPPSFQGELKPVEGPDLRSKVRCRTNSQGQIGALFDPKSESQVRSPLPTKRASDPFLFGTDNPAVPSVQGRAEPSGDISQLSSAQITRPVVLHDVHHAGTAWIDVKAVL
ncbi:hypothetical protein V8F33_001895 [Rhypophila sp. PSN 637]